MADVGNACTDRGSTHGSGYSYIELENAVAQSGSIDEVCVFAGSAASGIEFASFYLVSGTTYATNGDTNGSNLSASGGVVTTFNAPGDFTAFDISSGEFIGMYFSGGTIDRDSGVGSIGYRSGDNIPTAGAGFTLAASRISLGANLQSAGISIPIVINHLRQQGIL